MLSGRALIALRAQRQELQAWSNLIQNAQVTYSCQLLLPCRFPYGRESRLELVAGCFYWPKSWPAWWGVWRWAGRKLLSWLSSPVMAEGPGAHPLPASSDRSVRQGMLAWWSPSPLQVLASRAAGVQDLGLPWWLRWLRICLQYKRPGFNPCIGKIPWRMEWQPTPVFMPGKSHGQRSLSGYSLLGCEEADTTDRLTSSHRSPQTPPPQQTDGS